VISFFFVCVFLCCVAHNFDVDFGAEEMHRIQLEG